MLYICYIPSKQKIIFEIDHKNVLKNEQAKKLQKKKKKQPNKQANKSEIQILFCHAILHLGAHKFLFKCDKTKICT